MFKKILKISLVLFFISASPKTFAESVVKTDAFFQEIKITQNDFEHWIQTPNAFTSLAIQSDYVENLKVVFNPYSPLERDVVFENDEYSELLFVNPTNKFLLTTEGKSLPRELTVYLFDTRGEFDADNTFAAGNTNLNGLTVISRSQWGANENLRYYDPEELDDDESNGSYSLTAACQKKVDAYPNEFKYSKVVKTENGNYLTWPLQYSDPIKKIVVHHTGEADVSNNRPSDEMMRAIYYYHTVVKGWGDIGYHYVIGKDGEIFEGKAGGEKVVGAHVYCNNINTIGVSVMGNFNLEEPNAKQLNSLKALLAQLTKKYNIEPNGYSTFHGENLPNILGHRDLAATACPGENLYGELSSIRKEVAKGFTYNFQETSSSTTEKKDYNAEVAKKIDAINLDPTHQETLVFSFKNTGKQTWNDTTWLHVALNNNANAWAENIVPDKKYVAADMREKSVKPGQTATFEVTINAGYKAGFYILEFAPVVNNKYKLSQAAILQPINIAEPNFGYSFVKAQHPPSPFYTEEMANAWVELKNTGNIVWRNYGENKIYLGTQNPQDRKSVFSSDGRQNRLGYMEEREVYPGQIGHFIMPLTAPERRGIYTESFAPVIEGIRWLDDIGMKFRIIVKVPTHQIRLNTVSTLLNLNPETEKTISVSYKNLSDVNWKEDQVYFLIGGDYQALGIEDNTVQLNETLAKNSTGSFKFKINTPLRSGLYNLTVVPVIRGKKFEDSYALTIRVIVKEPAASGEVTNKVPKTVKLDIDEMEIVTIKVKNTSNFTWKREKTYLETLNKFGRTYVKDKWETRRIVGYMKEKEVEPGENATFTLYLKPRFKGYLTDVFKVKIDGFGYIEGVLIAMRVKAGELPVVENATTKKQSTQNTTPTNTVFAQSVKTNPETSVTTKEFKISENPIRVRLSVPNEATAILSANQNYTIKDQNGNIIFYVEKDEKTKVRRIGNFLHIQVGSTNKVTEFVRFVPNNGGIMEISSWENRPAWNQNLNDNLFRGIIELRILENKLVVINELPLEDYLKGIAEVSNNDPTEKLKTMAVLARTYALFYLQDENEKFPGRPYDASDDPNVFQKYLGYGLEKRSPNFIQAIEATKNEVVKYNGKLVKTPYFNQSNGRTLSAEEVWGWTNTPYLVSVEDPDCAGLTRKGHGVGLSGYGATKKAERGETYQEIIKYYYQNVEIEGI